jgi:hypothetical protein
VKGQKLGDEDQDCELSHQLEAQQHLPTAGISQPHSVEYNNLMHKYSLMHDIEVFSEWKGKNDIKYSQSSDPQEIGFRTLNSLHKMT